MYLVKVFKDKVLKNVLVYNEYENALSDVVSGYYELYGERGFDISSIDFDKPEIVMPNENDKGFACDMEFRYPNGITACIESPLIQDEI